MVKAALNTIQLLWAALGFLVRRPGLLLFAPLWTLASIAVLSLLVVVLEAGGAIERITADRTVLLPDVAFLLFAYILGCFATLYVTSSFVAAVYHSLESGVSDLRVALEAANERLGEIAIWASFAGTLGVLLKPLTGSSRVQRFLTRLGLESTSQPAAALVVPAMMIEHLDPLSALARANDLYGTTWTARAVPNFSIAIAYAFVVAAAATGAASVFLLTESPTLASVEVALLLLVGVTVLRTLETVIAIALYYYAVAGDRGILPERISLRLRAARAPRSLAAHRDSRRQSFGEPPQRPLLI